MKKYKVLKPLSKFYKDTILKENKYNMYYDQDGDVIDACIVENCPTVFEEIIELPYEIIKDEFEILAIIRKSDRQRFQLGDNISINGVEGFYIIDEIKYIDEKLYIIENSENEIVNKYFIDVLKELEGMTLENCTDKNNEEILEILEQMKNFYNESFTKITKILNK